MTAPSLGVEDTRRLLSEARAVVESIDRIAADAPDAEARAWAEHLAESAHARWDDVLAVVVAGDADRFDRLLHSLVAFYVPLQDAPASVRAMADQATSRTNVLARDLRETFEPLLTPDKALPASVLVELAAALRTVAGEFA